MKWKFYDHDVHASGTGIAWNIKDAELAKLKFLSSNLNLTKMNKFFLEQNQDTENVQSNVLTLKCFWKTSSWFHKPKKDYCSICTAYKNMTADQRSQHADA